MHTCPTQDTTLAPFQAPMIVLRDADKIHVVSIIAESVILYQGTFESVTAAFTFCFVLYLTTIPLSLIDLLSIAVPQISRTLHRNKRQTSWPNYLSSSL